MAKLEKVKGQNRYRRAVPQLFVILAAAGTAGLTALICALDPGLRTFPGVLWLLLIVPGIFIGLCALPYVLTFIVSLFLPKREPKREHPFLRAVAIRVVEESMLFGRIRVRVEGLEKLDPDGQYLFVSNHTSNFDPMLGMVYLARFRPIYVTKPSNMKIPLGGPFMHVMRYQGIDRENPRNALKTLNRCIELARDPKVRYSVGIYPEGTRSRTGVLLPFHEGVFMVARNAPLPVAVLSCEGLRPLTKNFPRKRTDVTIRVCEVIPAEEAAALHTRELSDRVRRILLKEPFLSETTPKDGNA